MCRSPFHDCRPCSLTVWAATWLVATGLGAREPAESLRLQWEPGQVYTQETTTDSTTVLTAIGMPEDQKMKLRQTTLITVDAAQDGEKVARVTFTAIAGEMQVRGQKLTFDSDNMAAAPAMIRQSLGESVGQSFVLRYSSHDEFLGVQDTASMIKAPDGVPALTDIARAKEVAELYRRSLEMGLPKAPVRVGDRWTGKETVHFPKAGTMEVELRATFDARVTYEGREHAKITFEGEMKRPGGTEGEAADRSITLGEGSKTSGQLLYDLQRRTVSISAFHADLNLAVDGKVVPVRQQVTTKLVKMEAAK